MDILLLQGGIFIVSIAALLWASDKFVEAAENIGLSLGISPFIIGVTIVAFGTSLPELATHGGCGTAITDTTLRP